MYRRKRALERLRFKSSQLEAEKLKSKLDDFTKKEKIEALRVSQFN